MRRRRASRALRISRRARVDANEYKRTSHYKATTTPPHRSSAPPSTTRSSRETACRTVASTSPRRRSPPWPCARARRPPPPPPAYRSSTASRASSRSRSRRSSANGNARSIVDALATTWPSSARTICAYTYLLLMCTRRECGAFSASDRRRASRTAPRIARDIAGRSRGAVSARARRSRGVARWRRRRRGDRRGRPNVRTSERPNVRTLVVDASRAPSAKTRKSAHESRRVRRHPIRK